MLSQSTINVIQLGSGFFLNFFAFNTQGFIEEPVIESAADRQNINVHAGYYSLSIIYAMFTIANFVAAPVVDILTPKWAMTVGGLCYAVFQAGFLSINEVYLYLSSAVLGFGAAILWTGQGTYLSQNSTEQTSGRNSAILWALCEGSLIAGGLFLFAVFHSSQTTDNIPYSTTRILYGVFTVQSCFAALTFSLLRPQSLRKVDESKSRYVALLGSTFRLMFTKRMLILAFVFAYTGIEQAFWTGIYPTCISFTQQLGTNTNALLALNSIAAGLGQVAAGLLFGILGARTRKIGRDAIVFMGAVLHILTFAMVYMNIPDDAPLQKTTNSGAILTPNTAIALICGSLLGFGDACWNTQIYSFLCDRYSDQSSEAFAIFKFYQSLLSCAVFFYTPLLKLSWHLLILSVTSIIAAICFFVTERSALPHRLEVRLHAVRDLAIIPDEVREPKNTK